VNLNPDLLRASNEGDSFFCLYVVDDNCLLGSSITAIGISLSHMILPCESVGGPGKSNLLDFLTGCCLGQYSIVHLVQT
jgi:hypothetical protein